MRELLCLLVLGSCALVGRARAAGPDFSAVVGGVDFSAVALAVLAIGALMIVVRVASWGADKVLGFIDDWASREDEGEGVGPGSDGWSRAERNGFEWRDY